ncbi:Ribosomal protein S6 kinase [Temnothorax longispinosus]|uniref:Ribosomal protein S6 kinase n=1 Tax=Temnothorax longispinosus TaxID=300112 RepID=A0A4S2KS20_9HYME|nr:Ribosomal protein S6 kinase [Temnothorax longispinosus]
MSFEFSYSFAHGLRHLDRFNVLNSLRGIRCEFDLPRMAGVFDIELHDGDAANQDESDDDVIENREEEYNHAATVSAILE